MSPVFSLYPEISPSVRRSPLPGCPAGLPLSEEDIQVYLDRRKPGQSRFTTPRVEEDACRILSGLFEGKTTGTPILMMIENRHQISADYSDIASYYRPGHADYTFDQKYGFRDYRGAGRSSGRETSARVMAGAVAAKILSRLGITVRAFTASIGPIHAKEFDFSQCLRNPLYMPDENAALLAQDYVSGLMEEKDSSGGIIGCIVTGLPAGIGDPVFDKLDARLAQAVMSIGAVKGVEFGAGFLAASMRGSECNDQYYMSEDKSRILKRTNNAGGILGGITDGSALIMNVAVKPTSSIARKQQTVNKNNEEIEIEIKGRHDPLIVPRAVVVVECMTALTILDRMLVGMSSRLSDVVKVYNGE